MAHALSARLAEGPLLCDGAMGTVLYAHGIGVDGCFEALNVSNPKLVQAIHAEYIAAGADLIETNTFAANRFKLSAHGRADEVREINRAGARLARDVRESMGRDVFVLGSVGPLGRYLAPLGTLTHAEARAAFREQVEALLEGGIDAFILETFGGLTELRLAIEVIRALTDAPIVAQMAFTDEALTYTGRTPVEVARVLSQLPVQAVGGNCSVGSSVLFEVLEQMLLEAGGMPLSIQPNAGLPTRVEERLLYLSSPPYMAEWAAKMVEAGARIVGGCCGTTAAHISAMREAVDATAPGARVSRPRMTVHIPERRETARGHALPPPTPLQQELEAGHFVVSVELDPPRGHTLEKLVQGAMRLRDAGVRHVDINDGSLGRVRMAVVPTALLVREATGLDVTMHVTCRDRNLMGIQADLLAACALGLRNVLAMTGDPPRAGDYSGTTAVFDLDAIGLIEVIRRMNDGQDATGNAIGGPTSFHVGAVLNPAAEDTAREVERFHRKIEAGARWVQTQPVYELEQLDRFLRQAGGSPVPVVVGLLPLHSARHAEFLHNEVPGITVPDHVRARMREAGDHGLAVGVAMAQELLALVRARYAGAYLMPSFGRFEVVAEVLDALG
jgi:homocysteine S-methyltransferase